MIDAELLEQVDAERAISPLRQDQSGGFFGEAIKGLDSSTTGIHGGLRAMGGTIAEAMGADEFAQAQYARARELQARAQTEAPRISSYKQVLDDPSFANARDYVGGLLGGSLPSIGLGMGAGMLARTAAGGLMAGTLAQTPIEASDVAMKQLNDPEAMDMAPLDRFGRQVAGGAGSAALQTVVPNWIGGKLVGRGAEQAAKQTVGQVVGHNAMAIPSEGFFEGASDVVKQYASNDQRPTDWDSVAENVVGGAAAGGALAGVGTAGDLITRNVPMARNAIGTAFDAAQAKMKQGKEFAGGKMDDAANSDTWKFMEDIAETGKAMASGAWDAASDVAKAMEPSVKKKGEQVAEFLKTNMAEQNAAITKWKDETLAADDVPAEVKRQLTELLKATPGVAKNAALAAWKFTTDTAKAAKTKADTYDVVGSLRAALTTEGEPDTKAQELANEQMGAEGQKLNDQNRLAKAKAKVDELMTDGRKAASSALSSVQEHIANIENPAVQSLVDTAHRGWKATKKKATDLSEFVQSEIDARWPEASKEGTAVKKSEDFHGTRKVLSDAIVPWLKKNSPDTLDDEDGQLDALGGTLHKVVTHMYKHPGEPMPPEAQYAMFKTFEDETDNILKQLHAAVGTTDAADIANFELARDEMFDAQQAYEGLTSLIRDQLDDQSAVSAPDVAANLLRWATKDTGQNSVGFSDETANVRTRLESKQINAMLLCASGISSARRQC